MSAEALNQIFHDKSLRDLIGKHYDELFYNLSPDPKVSEKAKKIRYYVYKGSRASKKSYTVAYWILINMMFYDKANTLVVRKVAKHLSQSCYALLEKCMYNLGIRKEWKCSKSPMEMVRIKTGQKIIFRGMDDVQNITSTDVTNGVLCWSWVEEAYQINKKEDFSMLDESIRGKMPEGLFKRIILTFNPWNKSHWLRTTFFETEEGKPLKDPKIFAKTTNYLCNEWLDEEDYELYERMKTLNPKRYLVAGLGEWGSPEGLIYDNWEEFRFDYNMVAKRKSVVSVCGLDFGFSADPTAMVCALVDMEHYEIYVYDELYETGLTSPARYKAICDMGHRNSLIYYDQEGALDAQELIDLGLSNMIPCRKGTVKNRTILTGINNLRNFHIYIHPDCVNFLTEIQNYMWYVDKDGRQQDVPQPGSMDHLMDAIRYIIQGLIQASSGGFVGTSGEEILADVYQYKPLSKEEIEQRKAEVQMDIEVPRLVVPNAPKEEDDYFEDDEEEGAWCYST